MEQGKFVMSCVSTCIVSKARKRAREAYFLLNGCHNGDDG